MTTEHKNLKRGFALLDPETRKQIASKGAKALHANGKAHHFTSSEAVQAGRKGGLTTSQNKEHMANIGRKGGSTSANSHKA